MKPAPRSLREHTLYKAVQKCRNCNAPLRLEVEREFNRVAGYRDQQLTGTCGECGTSHEFVISVPTVWPSLPAFSFGAEGPSPVITADQFRAAASRHLDEVADDPATLTRAAYFADRAHLLEARALLHEALLCGSASEDVRNRFEEIEACLARSERELARNQAAAVVHEPGRTLTREMVEAHRTWQLGGRKGTGRLDADGLQSPGARLSNAMLAEARLANADLSRANLSFSNFALAELGTCNFDEAVLSSAIFDQATVEECTFRAASLGLANFRKATIRQCDFRKCFLDRGELTACHASHVDFREAILGDSVFDQAVMEDCDFRGADLSRKQLALQLATTRATRFVRCDFRGANFEGRRLEGTVFEDCKFAGVTGQPTIEDVYSVQRPDFSESGNGSEIRDEAAILALWGTAPSCSPVGSGHRELPRQ